MTREGYFGIMDTVWEEISIYDGPEAFLRQFEATPETARTVFAAHFAQSEICNGGFAQFFGASTGVLAPEAVAAFKAIGMPRTAAVVEKAMLAFGPVYPRDRKGRCDQMDVVPADGDIDLFDFEPLDTQFFGLIEEEASGFENAANGYVQMPAQAKPQTQR